MVCLRNEIEFFNKNVYVQKRRYQSENGEMFRGKILSLNYSGFHLVRDADENLFWLTILPEDFNNGKLVSKTAKPGTLIKKLTYFF